MDERELGWEDVGSAGREHGQAAGAGAAPPALGGMLGEGGEVPGISDAVTSAMVNHFARELSKGSLSLWPQFIVSARRYFNVTHGYVLRKALWQLVPLTSTKKKSGEGELGGEKDWTVRMFEGLEVDIEEPDLYIPAMGFVTYVLLCGIIRGLQEQFHPGVLSATVNFAVVLLIVETTIVKAVLFTAGAVNSPVVDLVALLGYKFFYLSLQLAAGLLLGWGCKPTGLLYHAVALALAVSCGVALWQALRRLARMQPSQGQECVSEVHKWLLKVLPVIQALACWCLLPTWPKPHPAGGAAVEAAAVVAKTAAAAVAAVATNASGAVVGAAAGDR